MENLRLKEYSNINWSIDDEGTLIIRGNGDLEDFTFAPWHDEAEEINKVIIEEGVTRIGDNAFYGLYNLKSALIPSSVYEIGYSAFSNCEKLETVEFADDSSLLGIRLAAFFGCHSLREITLPERLAIIGNSAFEECISLEKIVIPQRVSRVCENAFKNCENLNYVGIEYNMEAPVVIPRTAFCGCSDIEFDAIAVIPDEVY